MKDAVMLVSSYTNEVFFNNGTGAVDLVNSFRRIVELS
jgi:hypothetical protein